MNAYQDFVAARPVVEPPEQDELDAIWAQVVGELTGSLPTAEPSPAMRLAVRPSGMTPARLRDVPSHHSVSRRRPLVLVAAAACVVLLVALIAVVARPDGPAQVDEAPPSTPASSWQPFAQPDLDPRFQPTLLATDSGIFVWGGCCDARTNQSFTDGAFYDAATATWRPLPDAPIGGASPGVAVWTGSEVIALSSATPASAAAFDPQSFTWRTIAGPTGTGADGAARLLLVGDTVALVDRTTVELFDLTTEVWSQPVDIGHMGSPSEPVRSLLADGAVSDHLVAMSTRALAPCAPATVHILDTTTQAVVDVDLPDNGWWPSDLVGMGGGTFLAFGASSCGENEPTPDPRAFVVDASGAAPVEVAAPPFAPGNSFPSPSIWTGDAVVGVTTSGRLAVYRPDLDNWSVGDALVAVTGSDPGERIDGTPIVWFDDRVIVISPSFVDDAAGAQVCCSSLDGAWSTPIPEPVAPLITITPTLPE